MKKKSSLVLVGILILGLFMIGSCGKANTKDDSNNLEIKSSVTDYSKIATGTKYYVSTSGDDNNDGLTPETPVKSLEKAASFALEPGDGLFFKRGDKWKGEQLQFYGSGTRDNPVYLSAYGEGNKPIITQAGKDEVCITISNSAGLIVSSLELSESYGGLEIQYNESLYNTNFATTSRVFKSGEAMNRDYLVIEDIYAHDMIGLFNSDEYQYNHTSFGLAIKSRDTTEEEVMLSNMVIRNCNFYNCNVGMLLVSHIGTKFDHGSDVGIIENFLIENNTAILCGQWGMHFAGLKNGIMRYNTTKYTGQNANNFGSGAFIIVKTTNVLIDHLLIDGHYRNPAQAYDGCGFDFEAGNVNVTLQNSIIKNIDGCAVFIFDNGANNDNIDILIKNCVFENYGTNVNETYACGILFASNSTGMIKDCTFKSNRDMEQIPVTRMQKGSLEGFVIENNKYIQEPIKFEWDFSIDGNIQTFGTTNFYYEGSSLTVGSTTESIKCKNGYLSAYYGSEDQYIQGPTYIACNLKLINSLQMRIKNSSTATRMKFVYTLTTISGNYEFDFELPKTGDEITLNLNLNQLISDKRGYIRDFKLYLLDGTGEVSIASIILS